MGDRWATRCKGHKKAVGDRWATRCKGHKKAVGDRWATKSDHNLFTSKRSCSIVFWV